MSLTSVVYTQDASVAETQDAVLPIRREELHGFLLMQLSATFGTSGRDGATDERTTLTRPAQFGDRLLDVFPHRLGRLGPRPVMVAESSSTPCRERCAGIRSGHAGADGGCPIGGARWS